MKCCQNVLFNSIQKKRIMKAEVHENIAATSKKFRLQSVAVFLLEVIVLPHAVKVRLCSFSLGRKLK